ncbi:MAG: hypothetical protein H0T73_14615, partial [Ardenticatenales bacterium]|nr:hypothetical protein [Ardenticatenales bacterium]
MAGALLLTLLFVAGVAFMQRQTGGGNAELGVALVYTLPFLMAGAVLCLLPLAVRGACLLLPRFAVGGTAKIAAGNLARQPGRALLTTATIT